jgi:hypothetical protein
MEKRMNQKAQKMTGTKIQVFHTVEAVAAGELDMRHSVSVEGPHGVKSITPHILGDAIPGMMVTGKKMKWFVPASNIKEVVFTPEE